MPGTIGPDLIGSGCGPILASLLAPSPWITESEVVRAGVMLAGDGGEPVVVVDTDRRPIGLVDRDAALVGQVRAPLKANVHCTVVETAQRMLTRPRGERLHPAVCHDDLGRYLGTLPAERIMRALATLAAPAVPAPPRRHR